MKKQTALNFGLLLLTLAATVACHDQADGLAPDQSKNLIGFGADLSRSASITSIDNLTSMRVHCVTSDTDESGFPTTGTAKFFNAEYVNSGSSFCPSAEELESREDAFLWGKAGTKHHFLMTAPFDAQSVGEFNAGNNSLTLTTDFNNAAQKNFEDLLYASLLNVEQTSGVADVTLKRAYARVSIKAKAVKADAAIDRHIFINSVEFVNVAKSGTISFGTSADGTFAANTAADQLLDYEYFPSYDLYLSSNDQKIVTLDSGDTTTAASDIFSDGADGTAFFFFPQAVAARDVQIKINYFEASEAEHATLSGADQKTAVLDLTNVEWARANSYSYTATFNLYESGSTVVSIEGFEDAGDPSDSKPSGETDGFEGDTDIDNTENKPVGGAGGFEDGGSISSPNPSIGLEGMESEELEL